MAQIVGMPSFCAAAASAQGVACAAIPGGNWLVTNGGARSR
jgi:hypothetical protein